MLVNQRKISFNQDPSKQTKETIFNRKKLKSSQPSKYFSNIRNMADETILQTEKKLTTLIEKIITRALDEQQKNFKTNC